MPDDIGDYYRRKDAEKDAALEALKAHAANCPLCHKSVGAHRAANCVMGRILQVNFERAAYVGD